MDTLKFFALALLVAVLVVAWVVLIGEPTPDGWCNTATKCVLSKAAAVVVLVAGNHTLYKTLTNKK